MIRSPWRSLFEFIYNKTPLLVVILTMFQLTYYNKFWNMHYDTLGVRLTVCAKFNDQIKTKRKGASTGKLWYNIWDKLENLEMNL